MSYEILNIEAEGKKLVIFQDEHSDSPRNWDNLGKMICFHKRYNLGDNHDYDHRDYSGWDEMKKAIEKNEDTVFILPLFLYDHSGITISTSPFHCRWDSGQVGFIIARKENVKKEFGVKRITKKVIEKIETILRAEVEIYDQYIRGDVYGFSVLDENENVLDSVHGFYGTDWDKNGIGAYIEDETLRTKLMEKII